MKPTPKQAALISEQIPSVAPGETYTYFTNAKFSSYHIVQHLLTYTGIADVFITSFSISEQSLLALKKLQTNGFIGQVRFILNHQTRNYFANLMPLCRKIGEVRFTNIHMKIILLAGAAHTLAISTSGNFSVSKALESGTIFTVPKIFDLYYSQFDRLWNSQTHS